MFRGNPQHTGVAASSIPITLPLEPKWGFHKSTRGTGVTSSPAVWQGMVFFGCDDGKFRALETKTGKDLWKFQAVGRKVSSPAVWEGIVFFGCGDGKSEGKLCALEAKSGKELWEFKTGASVWSPPAVCDGMILVVAGKFYALEARTGGILGV
jgi:outer membrane protein assembly factor BamB